MHGRTTRKNAAAVEWAVSLALRDLDAMRPGDWLNLRDELSRFMGLGGVEADAPGFVTSPDPTPSKASEESIRKLQADVLAILTMALAMRDGGGQATVYAKDLIKTTVEWSVMGSAYSGSVLLMAKGDLSSMFRLRVLFLLAQEGAHKILRCPVCQRPFWKSGRKKYCSRRCTNKAVFSRWLETSEKGRTRSKDSAKQARKNRAYRRQIAERRRAARGGAA